MIEGRIHSIETMGLVDGPGIRTVIFLQGCPLKCSYCHNPDSQTMFSKNRMTPEDVLRIGKRYKSYYDTTGGGITFSGGEPLLQGRFLSESLKLLKKEGFHTAIDTSGYGDEKFYNDILANVDIILLDIKHFDNEGYRNITGKSMQGFYKFLSYLENFNGKIWLRHVMVPGITDDIDSVKKIFNQISYLYDKIDRIEVLPYHKSGLMKYEELGMEYKLKGVPEMDIDKAKEFEDILMEMLNKEKAYGYRHKDIV